MKDYAFRHGVENFFGADELEVDLATGEVRNTRSGTGRQARPFSDRMIEIWRAGSLTRAMRARLAGPSAK